MTELTEIELAKENLLVSACWNLVVQHSNRILFQAGLYGFKFMDMPNPNARELLRLLRIIVIPALKGLDKAGTIDPLNGVKINTMSRTISYICDITTALEKENQEDFAAAVTALRKQPLIHN